MIKKILVYIFLIISVFSFSGLAFAIWIPGSASSEEANDTSARMDASTPTWWWDSWDENDISSSAFMLDVSKLSPSDTKYELWAEGNIKELSLKIVRISLVMLPTLSLLFMVIGAIMMITSGGSSEKITKWKNIVIYNIVAIVVALLSYSIVKLIIWILWSN
ncbi:MAG: hypothetical protein ACD_49C00009G0052 [uncultured bacterium (gcode 4)]|uniref:Uncharacterized protein n=1 Tax=uncultured bacterium (gcode 4) TaxID=1234023 RepID=K2AYJ7_9BACT|nr:MAG: hypothetical protein ACD_49C00009G0052 [uncultured bacterium (gcode 4)]